MITCTSSPKLPGHKSRATSPGETICTARPAVAGWANWHGKPQSARTRSRTSTDKLYEALLGLFARSARRGPESRIGVVDRRTIEQLVTEEDLAVTDLLNACEDYCDAVSG